VRTAAEIDFICSVGAGTPMGETMRRYWWPVALSDELPTPDSDPILIQLLGQRFVAFRDTEGRVGILDEFCCHRNVSLLLGRVEDCGLRCIFHGWKFAVDGTLLEAPNVESPAFVQRVAQPAYPVHEEGGFIWTYIGPPEHEPPFRRLWWMDLPEEQRHVAGSVTSVNYVQILEIQGDAWHAFVLHRDSMQDFDASDLDLSSIANGGWQKETVETDFGWIGGSIFGSTGGPGASPFGHVSVYIAPTINSTGPGLWTMLVPMDDVTTMGFVVTLSEGDEHAAKPPEWEASPEIFEQVTGRLLSTARPMHDGNRYLQDRSAMRTGSFSGLLGGILHEDNAVLRAQGRYPTVAQGANEHLVASDNDIVRLRRFLANLARQVADDDRAPGVSTDVSELRCFQGLLDGEPDWKSLVPANLHSFLATPAGAASGS
jgi:nitrite reductase/ring-hydroxylating ferredoxin subunit